MSINVYDSSTQTLTKVPGTETAPFTGASSNAAGKKGLVPAPAAGAQNKVLGGDGTWKAVDTTPTEDSTNAVQSGGVYDELSSVKQALSNEAEVRAKLGAHNLIDTNTLLLGDPNGANIFIRISTRGSRNIYLASGESVDVKVTNTSSDVQFCLYFFDAATYTYVSATSWLTNTTYTATQDCYVVVSFRHSNDASINASDVATAKVLARYSKDAYTGFTPFAPMNSQLLSADANAALGAHNLFKFPTLAEIKARNTSGSWNDNVYSWGKATFTINSDDTITINCDGTGSNSSVYLVLYNRLSAKYYMDDGNYIINGLISSDANKFSLAINATTKNATTEAWGVTTTDLIGSAFTVNNSQIDGLGVSIPVFNNFVVDNVVVKPQIRLASDPSTKFSPYAMTNQQLTENKAEKGYTGLKLLTSTDLSAIVPNSTKEILVMAYVSGDYSANVNIYILVDQLTSNDKKFYSGAYFTASDNCGASVIAKIVSGGIQVTFEKSYANGVDLTIASKAYVYYR